MRVLIVDRIVKLFKKTIAYALILILSLLCGCQNSGTNTSLPEVTGQFAFTVMKAGQADAIIAKTQNHNVIIDLGEKDDGDEISEFLEENNITDVDYIFITHYDKDHVGGFPEVMENITAKNIVVPDYEGISDEYKEFIKTVDEKNLTVTRLTEDISFVLDDVLFEVSAPKKQIYKEGDNDYSLVISVTHGENTFLFAGDAEKERLSEVLSEFDRQFDFLKVPHHGRYNGKTEEFISAVKPKYAVITDSEKNPASDKTISVLKMQKSEIYSTKDGNVSVLSDGKKILINQ
ncbi:MAG: MBL fold metallo-hydrolase [Clostridia bacterium]|nr:MBL fold metallo-hydrolase [Clostridia bacterium]